MIKVGITGGIGSGKSTVARVFQLLGAPIYYADDRAKALMTENKELMQAVIATFGKDSYVNGAVNRTYLASKVFSSPDELAKLNALVHPAVGTDFEKWVSEQSAPYVLKEAALLYEAGSYSLLDKMITVFAPVEMRVKRVTGRDSHRTEKDIYDIIERQMPDEKKIELADFVVNNDNSELVIPQIMSIHEQLLKLN